MENKIEGRNAVLEALRAGKPIDKLYVLDGCPDGPVRTIIREAKKGDTIINYVKKERLDQLSETGHHQGVIAMAASYEYATVEDILEKAREKGEAPFIFVLDNIEDPHNLGAMIRTANLAGAHVPSGSYGFSLRLPALKALHPEKDYHDCLRAGVFSGYCKRMVECSLSRHYQHNGLLSSSDSMPEVCG